MDQLREQEDWPILQGVYFKEIVSKSSSRQVKLWVSHELEGLCDTRLLPAHAPFSLSIDQLPGFSQFLLSHNGLRMAWVALILGFTWVILAITCMALYVSSHSKHFPYSYTLNPYNKPTRHVLQSAPLYRWRHWDRRGKSILPQITQVGNNRAGTWSQAIWLQCYFPIANDS